MNFAAVIVAAGGSLRMGGQKKEYRILTEPTDQAASEAIVPRTVITAAVAAFANFQQIWPILIVIPPGDQVSAKAALPSALLGDSARFKLVEGGSSRRRSVHKALVFLRESAPDFVLIHDGARPWLDSRLIQRCLDAVVVKQAVIPVLPLVETPKEINGEGLITSHPQRNSLVLAQTPQCFAFPAILRAHDSAAIREDRDDQVYTDDAAVWADFIGPVYTIAGSPGNRKITFPEDLL